MDIAALWDRLAAALQSVSQTELLLLTFFAMLCGWFGTMLVRRSVPFGRVVSTLGTLALTAILLTVVLQLSALDPRMDFARPAFGAEQTVSGGETRVELARDGHFWLDAQVNGVRANFLVDTGATLTAISDGLAREAGLEPRDGAFQVRLQTANGSVPAAVTSIDSLSFGNIEANNLDAVIAPSLGTTNVLGMNMLSRLGSWRVEGDTLILVPEATPANN